MKIRIQIHSPGLQLHAVLRPEALPALIELVQTHRITDPALLGKGKSGEGHAHQVPAAGSLDTISIAPAAPVLSATAEQIRNKLSGLTNEQILACTQDTTFPEKIAALTGLLQARGTVETVRPRDIKAFLVRARQEPPSNPGRDFRLAWDQGWLARLQDREFVLTNSGWEKVGSFLA